MTVTTDTRPEYSAATRTAGPVRARLAFTIDRTALVDALATVALAVSKRPLVPTLGGVLLHAQGQDLILSATDCDTTASVRLANTVTAPGRLVLDHAELTKLLGALVKGLRKRDADALPVTIRDDHGTPVVDLAGYSMPVRSYPVEDYPALASTPPAVTQVDREAFAAEAARVLVATGTDDTLPAFTAVKFDLAPGSVTLAATDRFRLAVACLPAVSAAQATGERGALVPAPVLAALVKRCTGDRIRIGLDEADHPSVVSFTCGEMTMTTRTVEAAFPVYGRLLPVEAAGTVQTDRAALLAATRRAVAVLDAKRTQRGYLEVRVSNADVSVAPVLAEHADHVTAPSQKATVTGLNDGARYQFKPAYLTDALDSFHGDTVTLHLQSSTTRPVLFTDTPDGIDDGAAFRHLVMPVRPQDS